ncbi:MAG: ABC transporter ATP-binding protein [Deltaproteobacteria bacterium]|nr:ABC transporter ATP-binding protein [Deltaproteobacteria bacterium]
MPAVVVSSLTKRFGDLDAVRGVDLSMQAGEIFGLIGPDGAGKSTLIRMIAGLMKPTSGSIKAGDINVVEQYEKARHTIGYMPQVFGLYGLLTVEENLSFTAEIFGIKGSTYTKRLEKLYEFSGLGPFRRRRASQLSGGMKQKLGLSCVLLHRPEVILLDEPTNGVDPVSRREFWEMLHTIASEGKTILVSTPYMDEAERCHHVAFMEQGQFISFIDPVQELSQFPYVTVDITAEDPRGVSRALRDSREFPSVTLKGQNIHIIAELGEMGPGGVEKRVKTVAGKEAVVMEVSPTMQDVYLMLRKRQCVFLV